jgi:hypothetical protein
MSRVRESFPAGVLAVVLLLALPVLAGCVSAELEFDRMTGTAYPPDQIVSGNTVNLSWIYFTGGQFLAVDEDDTGISALSGTYISDAELDSLESANRGSTVGPETWTCRFFNRDYDCVRYHVYGIVTDHLYELTDGTNKPTIMGIMWTDDRRGFAMFYQNSTVSSNGAKYLRSAAHEIGHAYNLHHSDGDGSSTIMNQTKVVGNSFVYEFSPGSDTHLRDHPDNCRYPGMGDFGFIDTAHPDHGWTWYDCD